MLACSSLKVSISWYIGPNYKYELRPMLVLLQLFPYHTIANLGSMQVSSPPPISFHIQFKTYWILDYILLFLSYIASGQWRVQLYWWMLVHHKQGSGIYELLIWYIGHGIIGASHYGKCHSWTPCVPGICVTRHSVAILGMEPLGTL